MQYKKHEYDLGRVQVALAIPSYLRQENPTFDLFNLEISILNSELIPESSTRLQNKNETKK